MRRVPGEQRLRATQFALTAVGAEIAYGIARPALL